MLAIVVTSEFVVGPQILLSLSSTPCSCSATIHPNQLKIQTKKYNSGYSNAIDDQNMTR
jgi:hypothetical protein